MKKLNVKSQKLDNKTEHLESIYLLESQLEAGIISDNQFTHNAQVLNHAYNEGI